MRIALFDAVGTCFSAPSLRCMLEEFDRAGCTVDVYLREGHDAISDVCRASPHPFPIPFSAWCGDWQSTLRQWKWRVCCGGARGCRTLAARRYDLTVGLNPAGVIVAHRYAKRTGVPFVYLSFEMCFRDEIRREGLVRLKNEEIAASRAAAFVISTDRWRAAMLSAENGVPSGRIVTLPVAPRAGVLQPRTRHLRDTLKIADDQLIVLHAGNFTHFTCATEIIDTVPHWPSKFVFVVNPFLAPRTEDPLLARLRAVGGDRVRVTAGGKSGEEYAELVRSADIGLALYRTVPQNTDSINGMFLGKNIQTMGLSSGKFATFACHGVPVVCGGNPVLKAMLDHYCFGVYAETANRLPDCLAEIQPRLRACGLESRRFFEDELDFGRFWPAIWARMQTVAAGVAL